MNCATLHPIKEFPERKASCMPKYPRNCKYGCFSFDLYSGRSLFFFWGILRLARTCSVMRGLMVRGFIRYCGSSRSVPGYLVTLIRIVISSRRLPSATGFLLSAMYGEGWFFDQDKMIDSGDGKTKGSISRRSLLRRTSGTLSCLIRRSKALGKTE